ncbi:MAG TPA: PQQ-dependent sugar dehydrogenase [Abditibacteriaceae bacterium]|jgi:glucose/arabinose dehydrogenase
MTQLFRHIWLCLALLVALVGISKGASAANLPTGFEERLVASGLNNPTAMAFAPDGRLFICEQSGTVRVVKNGAKLATPFISLAVATEGERGLLGIAFDPDFAVNHYVYLYYTAPSPEIHNRVSRFTANGDVAVANSETVLLDLETHTTIIHNGGAMRFGPGGKLFIAVGENGTPSNAQSLNNLLGKMLRINKDGSIPTDNPFYNTAVGKNRAIWALGLRNPYTFDIERGTGRMFINDVGQHSWEEINEGIAGSNYGWPATEGATSDARFRSPVLAYPHTFNDTGGCAITGGAFYNAAQMPFPASYAGKYFYADHCVGWIRTLDSSTGGSELFATGVDYPVDLKVDAQGGLNYLARAANSVYRIVYSSSSTSGITITSQPQDTVVEVGKNATFSVAVSGEAPFTYQWWRDGAKISGATAATYSFAVAASDDEAVFSVVVTNSRGSVRSRNAVLAVSLNTAPSATISAPTEGTRYNAGDVISFSGDATDAEDGALPNSAFSWKIVFHHGTHTHPFRDNLVGIKSGTFTIPTQGETATDVFYRITLTVHDVYGSATSVSRDILPRIAQLQLRTNPAGLQVTLDGQPQTVPVNENSVVGIKREIGAPRQTINGVTYEFSSWSDGGAATHTVSTPAANTVYVANFRIVSDARPLVTIASPTNGAALRSLPLVRGTAAPANSSLSLARVDLYLQRRSDNKFWNGSAWDVSSPASALSTVLNGTNWSRTSGLPAGANLLSGNYFLAARAIDSAGNGRSAEVNFVVDTTAPTVAISSPASNASLKALPGISGSASDNVGGSGIGKVNAYLRRKNSSGALEYWASRSGVWDWGASVTPISTTLATTGSWGVSNTSPAGTTLPSGVKLPSGSYQVFAYAYDKAGNAKISSVNTFSIDATVPTTVVVTTPASGASIKALASIAGTSSDNAGGSGIGKVDAYLRRMVSGAYQYWALRSGTWGWGASVTPIPTTLSSNGAWSVSNTSPAGTQLPSGTTKLPSGSYQVFARAYDKAGNVLLSAVNTFTVVAGGSEATTQGSASSVVLSSASAQASSGTVRLVFTGALDIAAASDPARYSVTVEDVAVAIESVQLFNSSTVVLTLEEGNVTVGNVALVAYEIRDSKGLALKGQTKVAVK